VIIVKQAPAICIRLDSSGKMWDMLVTAAHHLKVPVPPEGQPVMKYGREKNAESIEYFHVRGIVVFGPDHSDYIGTFLKHAWIIVPGIDTQPTSTNIDGLSIHSDTSADQSSNSADQSIHFDTSDDESTNIEFEYLQIDQEYSICTGFSYFKPCRKHLDFALIDMSTSMNISPSDESSIQQVYGNEYFWDVEMMGRDTDFGPADGLKDAGFKVIGFTKSSMIRKEANSYRHTKVLDFKGVSLEEHLEYLSAHSHPLFERKFYIVEKPKPRWTWKGEDDGYTWKMPKMEREYVESPHDVGVHLLLAQLE
jgi:hypothetical protein